MKSITRYGRTRKPATVNRELAILSGIFRMAVDYEETLTIRVERWNLYLRTISAPGVCPMDPIVREALLELSKQSGNAEYVFTNPDTGTLYGDVKKSFSGACREAGVTNFTFHDLRHTFGTRLADAGVDAVKIKELMGHASSDNDALHHATDQGIDRNDVTSLSQTKNGKPRSLP